MTTDTISLPRLLVKRYQLLELVGTGAMGQVYRAEDNLLGGMNVAVKILSQKLLNNKMLKMFEQEAAVSAMLAEKSINIVKVKDYGIEENGLPFYVMEFLEGENFREVINYHSLPLPKFLNLVRQICTALEIAHNGIVFQGKLCPVIHRDIKPTNIFLIEDANLGDVIKILDFGLAEITQADSEEGKSFAGTLQYCSPEQIQGKILDNRSDIYSLGAVMYEMVTKEPPLTPEHLSFDGWYKAHTECLPKPFAPDLKLPAQLEDLIMSCLAKSLGDRPQNVGEMIHVIDKLESKLSLPETGKGQAGVSASQNTVKSLSATEEVYQKTPWPKGKPLQKIVFPRLVNTPEGIFPGVWAMLEADDIAHRESCVRYNHFIFQSYPYPMILWITALYNQEYGPRWLPCYLDLKNDTGQQVASILAESKSYDIVLFALQKPQKYQHILNVKLTLKQRTSLKEWVKVSKALRIKTKPDKKGLKENFEALKPEIVVKLQQASTDELHG